MNGKQARNYRDLEALDREFKNLEQHLRNSKLPLKAEEIEELHFQLMEELMGNFDKE